MTKAKKHLEILTEEQSAAAALQQFLPSLLGPSVSFRIISHQGRGDLLKKLPKLLEVYGKIFRVDQKLLVLIDRDTDDCTSLKNSLEETARKAGISTKSTAKEGVPFLLVNRIAIEEMEAWFLGDEQAVCAAYRQLRSFPSNLQRRNPDAIKNPFETLQKLLKDAGYRGIGGKIELARKIGAHLQPDRNRSSSFRVFCEGIAACLK